MAALLSPVHRSEIAPEICLFFSVHRSWQVKPLAVLVFVKLLLQGLLEIIFFANFGSQVSRGQ